MTPPRLMVEIGVDGERFTHTHPYSETCARYGCVPAETSPQDDVTQRLREAAQAVVSAWTLLPVHERLGSHALPLIMAMMDLRDALRKKETPPIVQRGSGAARSQSAGDSAI